MKKKTAHKMKLIKFRRKYENKWENGQMPCREYNLLHGLATLEELTVNWVQIKLITLDEFRDIGGVSTPYHAALNKLRFSKHDKRCRYTFRSGLKNFGALPSSLKLQNIAQKWSRGNELNELELRIFASAFFGENNKNPNLVNLKNLKLAVYNFSFN